MSRKKNGRDPATTFYDVMKESSQVNRTVLIERMYLRLLSEWAATRFKWVGLPDSIDPRFLEMELHRRALSIFYYDKNLGQHLAVQGASHGNLNYNHNPTSFYTVGIGNYRGVRLTDKDCVPIWGTYSRIPSQDVVLIYARRLAMLDVSLETNAVTLRNSRMIAAPESQRQTWANIVRQVDQGEPVIWGTDDLNRDQIAVFDIGGNPANLDSLRLEKNQVWNEAMTLLGITNSNQDKKERLVAAEAIGTNGQVMVARNSALKPRQEAAEKINELYGLSVSVEWDLEDELETGYMSEPPEKDGDNGNLHD